MQISSKFVYIVNQEEREWTVQLLYHTLTCSETHSFSLLMNTLNIFSTAGAEI